MGEITERGVNLNPASGRASEVVLREGVKRGWSEMAVYVAALIAVRTVSMY